MTSDQQQSVRLALRVPWVATRSPQSRSTDGETPLESLRRAAFHVLYLMFTQVASSALTVAASMAAIAQDLKMDRFPVVVLGGVVSG